MTVCAHRPESPGFFTSCVLAVGGCRCGQAVAAEQTEQDHTTTNTTEES